MMVYESWLVERAKEELEMLESQHPTRFHHLKLDLKSFISQPNSGAQLFPRAVDDDAFGPPLASAAVPTQTSSTRKRKTETERRSLQQKNKAQKSSSASRQTGGRDGSRKKSDSSVEAAIRRAQACLRRIQQVKQSLLFASKGQ
ncbi:unnamed protein product [Musa hybrid cultivar]